MIVEDRQIPHAHENMRVIEVHLDRIMLHRDHPEDVVRVDVRVEVVNLFREVGRSDWTGEQIESNKDERSLVPAAIRPNEHALVEAHIGRKRELRVARSAAGARTG
ncbi:MAG TPA: hypothetical protein VFZ98_03905 [Vicinamibacterales bacterium]